MIKKKNTTLLYIHITALMPHQNFFLHNTTNNYSIPSKQGRETLTVNRDVFV